MSWEADPRIIEEKQDLEKLIQNEIKQEDPKKHYKEIINLTIQRKIIVLMIEYFFL